LNTLLWNLPNNAGRPAAGGLYIHVLQADDGTQAERSVGKIIVIP
jgi:hypothetical protein